ncbi:rhodanese-like domain-containing protein [Myroides sp. LJL119]
MKNKFFLIPLLSLFVYSAALGQVTQENPLLSKHAFQETLKDSLIQLVDVRTPQEFEQGTIDKAINIDFLASDFLQKADSLDKDKPVYIFCKSGKRSAKARQELNKHGFTQVFELEGGYLNWSQQ